eukprot:8488239-Pyramimonas_sp.AAC.1
MAWVGWLGFAQGHSFCVKCRAEAHAPAECDIVLSWMKKCDDDSETFNWLSANTQVWASSHTNPAPCSLEEGDPGSGG